MKKTEIEEIKEVFNSIMCLAIEGPEVMRSIEIIDKIAKESERGYVLCCRHLTNAMHSDGEGSGDSQDWTKEDELAETEGLYER